MNPQISKLKIDPTKLTPEQRNQLETYQQAQEQLRALSDIADMTQEVINILDSQKSGDEKNDKQMGALLMDMRDSLTALNAKEAPEMPDQAKPVVEAVNKLEKALSASIKAIDVKPVVQAPDVNVSSPPVDTKGVERAVANLAKSFQEAIKLIDIPEPPEMDFQPLLDMWSGISEQLVSIENATRMKPLPGSMTISNLTGIVTELQTSNALYAVRLDDTTTTNVTYIGQAAIGSSTSSAKWQIRKMDETSGTIITWADADANFNNIWDNRSSLSYS